MHFASTVVRPPYEAGSAYLQVTSGCSHNACRFCTYYKDARFAVSPESEVEGDLMELASTGVKFPRIWLQGADPFLLSYEKLMRIAGLVHRHLPFVKTIGGYGRVSSLRNKDAEQLRKLKDAGYSGIVFGVESGDDDVLAFMNKGYQSSEIVAQLSKMDEAGLAYEMIYLCGLAGHGKGIRNARRSAEVFSRLHPDRILIASLSIFPDTPLMADIRSGGFIEEGEGERISEMEEFIRGLENDTLIDARNASAIVSPYGRIPEHKEEMIAGLQSAYRLYGEDGLRRMRRSLQMI